MEKITKIIHKTIKVLIFLAISPVILLSLILYWLMMLDDDDHVPFYKVFVWFFEFLKDIIIGIKHPIYKDLEENSND